MTSLLFAVAILAAVAALGARRLRRSRLRRAAQTRPGATVDLAIYVRSYDEIDEHLGGRRCACGAPLVRTGEGSRESGERRLRVARLVCRECEEPVEVFFDTTDSLH